MDVDHLKKCFQKISNEDRYYNETIETVIAQCELYRGNLLLAKKTLRGAATSALSSQSAFRKIRWYKSMAEVALWKGKLQLVEYTVSEAFKYLARNEIDQFPLRSFLYLPIATVYYLRNELKNALDYTTMCIRYAMQAKHVNEIIAANFLLAQIYLAIGEPENVRLCLQNMRSASIGNSPGTIATMDAYLAILSLATGDIIAVSQWAEKRKIREDEDFSLRYFIENLAYALLKFHQKKYYEANRFLKMLHKRCMKRNILLAVLQIDILYSSSLYASGEKGEARRVMEQSLTFAETERYMRPFVDYWQYVSPVLKDISLKPFHNKNYQFLMKILDVCGIAADSEIQKRLSNTYSVNITKRELEILKLMASGYGNKEIAQKAFISLDTVKTHVRHIFQKLEVNSRIQAMTKAKELQLF